MRYLLLILGSCWFTVQAQQGNIGKQLLTPELMWKLGRLSANGITKDKKFIAYTVATPDVEQNKSKRQTYLLPIGGGEPLTVNSADSLMVNDRVSPDGKYILSSDAVKLLKVYGKDFHPDLPKSNAHIYTSLNYRHWDEWEDGNYDHVFYAPYTNGVAGEKKDIMPNEPFDCPTKPFGGTEDFIWHPNSRHIIYVAKKKSGTPYALSTNTDLYQYDILTGTTTNLTSTNKGYDVNPSFSSEGVLAWMQMKREGYEADKQDIIIQTQAGPKNLTRHRDDIHVEGFKWSEDGRYIYFWAPINGTLQLFEVDNIGITEKVPDIRQITKGDFDITGIVGSVGDRLYVTRTNMNHAAEIYSVDIKTGSMQQVTHVNDAQYAGIAMCKTERRWVTTTDNKKMLVWVIYPPNFDKSKKYPSLLYCQGGPQSPLTQFYSFRWNFQLMASQGYIVIAPNRRGMPGHGTKWNDQISKDWGGQVMRDYLSATDAMLKEPFIDKTRVGCIGASFGGFSVFALASMHNNRFKTFISHDGVFDFRSMFGTTDELFFEYWEKGGAYWEKNNAVAQRSFAQSPSNFVEKWNRPIYIIQGGRDYRVPLEQAQQAFQAAQLRGLKSKFLYLPDENHWVLGAQNALVWQREFFKWLDETLN